MRTGSLAIGAALTAAWFVIAAETGHCAVAPQDYDSAQVLLPSRAGLPSGVFVTDDAGHRRELHELISRPTVLVFADYTCQTLCGPIVAFVATALERTGLRAGEQFQLIVVGLDPKDSASDAARMRRDHLGGSIALSEASTFVSAFTPALAT